ncbi:glycoside hydrolase family 2 protein [Leifsonia sp. P73]|uniref:glycoside hydrolase family 2 protein n=1 Tax=Leifsonia sp. P73 TaxID=3423959 RepID=UPI003DA3D7DA
MPFASREIEQGGDAADSQAVPRPEYPRPQFVRDRWLNLNGVWSFGFGAAEATEAAGTAAPATWTLDRDILVPFAPESERSGIGSTDFHPAVRYRRTVEVPAAWADDRLLLHFGAVDFDTTVWVDDIEVGRHRGGFTPFTIDITDAVAGSPSATFTLSVLAEDDHLTIQARGKQSRRPENYEAFYTRTTGIWQTVWIEPVAPAHFGRPVIRPDLPSSSFAVELDVASPAAGLTARVDISDADGLVITREVEVTAQVKPVLTLPIPADRLRTWSPEDPHLYTVRFTLLRGGTVVDALDSYAGMRSIAIDGRRVLLNGRPVFQRLVLDQGYWPDTLMTAPSDDALVADIELGMAAGFNGARLHQKVFEERYLFHADRLGYLVWGEFADWGAKVGPGGPQEPTLSFIAEWVEAVTRDLSHPSIVGWCPLNETFQPMTDRITVLDDATKALYAVTKAIDPTRPVIDASGYSHRVPGADIYDSHLYEQDPDVFAQRMGEPRRRPPVRQHRARRRRVVRPVRRTAVLLQRVRRHLVVGQRPRRRRLLGVRRSAAHPRGVGRPVPPARGHAAGRPRHVRLLLHPAHGRLPGEERRARLPARAEVRPPAPARHPVATRGLRARRRPAPRTLNRGAGPAPQPPHHPPRNAPPDNTGTTQRSGHPCARN